MSTSVFILVARARALKDGLRRLRSGDRAPVFNQCVAVVAVYSSHFVIHYITSSGLGMEGQH